MHWREGSGRTALSLEIKKIGRDYLLWMYGGQKHIGAVALTYRVSKNPHSRVLAVPGHRESELASALALKAVKVFKVTCMAMVGIHLDRINPIEIRKILSNALKLMKKIS